MKAMMVRKESDRITYACGFSLLLSQPWLHGSGFALGSTQAVSSRHVADAVFVNVIPTIIKHFKPSYDLDLTQAALVLKA